MPIKRARTKSNSHAMTKIFYENTSSSWSTAVLSFSNASIIREQRIMLRAIGHYFWNTCKNATSCARSMSGSTTLKGSWKSIWILPVNGQKISTRKSTQKTLSGSRSILGRCTCLSLLPQMPLKSFSSLKTRLAFMKGRTTTSPTLSQVNRRRLHILSFM